MNEIYVTVEGNAIATPVLRVSRDGQTTFAVFRLAHNRVRFDRGTGEVTETGTSYFGVTAFGALAINVARSVSKGQPVVVHGKVRVNQWDNGEKRGTDVDIHAHTVGFDLRFGQATFTKVKNPQVRNTERTADQEIQAAHAELVGAQAAGGRPHDDGAPDGRDGYEPGDADVPDLDVEPEPEVPERIGA